MNRNSDNKKNGYVFKKHKSLRRKYSANRPGFFRSLPLRTFKSSALLLPHRLLSFQNARFLFDSDFPNNRSAGCPAYHQHFSLRRIHNAFKHGILNTLPVIDALLCNLPQPSASSGIFRVYIIGDQYQHLVHLISTKRVDMRPSLPGDTVPTAMPAYTAPVPMAVFPPSKGG